MISELDIWRSGAVMVKRFGAGAAQEAAARAGRLLELGDGSGHAMWLQIAWSVDRLQRGKPVGPAH